MAAPPHPHHPPSPPPPHQQPQGTPQTHHPQTQQHHHGGVVRLLCSFGGRIFPRPHDHQLRYIGGETRIVAVNRSVSFAALFCKLAKLPGAPPVASVKYQLPHEDLDALISLANDEDVENMMDEYDRLAAASTSRAAVPRLRVFLFPPVGSTRFESVASQHQNWFVDALNGGLPGRLDRSMSEVSSSVSEIPDCLFGLDRVSDSHPDGEPPVDVISTAPTSPPHGDPPSPVKEKEPTSHGNQTSPEPVHDSVCLSKVSSWPQLAPQAVPIFYMPYCHPVHMSIVNPVHPGMVYVSSSSNLSSLLGVMPPVVESCDPMAVVPFYPTVGMTVVSEPAAAAATAAEGRAVCSQPA